MIKAVIFDLDDTLCNSTAVIEDILRNIFAKYLKYFPDKSVDDLISINIKTFERLITDPNVPLSAAIICVWFEVFEQVHIKSSLKIILQLIEHIRKKTNKKVKLIDGTLEVMNYLKSKDIRRSVLTNGIFTDQAKKLVKLKLDSLIDYLVTSDMCAADKPDPKIFKYLLNKMDILPSETLMIGGDLMADIKGADDLGITTIYLKNSRPRNVDIKLVRPDYTETNYKDILKLLKQLTA